MLDVLVLMVALVAIAFAVVAVIRARTADETAVAARQAAEQSAVQADAARHDAARALEQAGIARQDAAKALDQSTTARQDAARALESADAAALALERRAVTSGAGGPLQGHAIAAAEPVRWTLEHTKGALWLMKNIGDATAHAALLSDATQPPKYLRPDEVIPRDVPPQDHLQFRVTPGRGGPPPRVRVTWREDGSTEPKSKDVTLLLEQ